MNVLSAERQTAIIAALTEGVSIRATERLTDTHRDTIMRLGVQVGQGCARLHDSMFQALPSQLIQLDEIWSFIGVKQGHMKEKHPPWAGDCYTWIALDATNKAILSYRVGKRSWEDCQAFIFDLKARLFQQVQITSDGYAPYAPTIRAAFGWNVDYGQIRKVYEGDEERQSEKAQHRYSPGRVVDVEREPVFGFPKEDKISTSYVERSNLTIRMQMRRFTRLTNAFSRKPENHAAAVALHVGWYNFCHLHEALRVTPAMAVGVTDHPWTIGELVERALSAPVATPPATPVTLPRLKTVPMPARGGAQLRVIRGGRR